eukprot:CAMPEP_0114552862 /NCGR_PEP_ID=MMETSP0114-20121206/7347_1 /TAXON_ID=31324 /ORGANISM="Goniomonas sp, Strain m" /LENGTH=664 /DNA_ID=CAMNT_0001737759 /DNA_START=88 /DNA_END=2082 /DNA_ORIENTATION=+
MKSIAPPGTIVSGSGVAQRIPEGQYTSLIYGWIRDEKYPEVIRTLTGQLLANPRSRAALSLLGYCYYQTNDFQNASAMYETLCRLFPSEEEYKVYYAQALHKANLYEQANKVAVTVDVMEYQQRMLMLQAASEYEMDDLASCKSHLSQCLPDDPDTIVALGCVTYKEGEYEQARLKFAEAVKALGYQSSLAYNMALCYYRMKQYGPAMKAIAEIIERGVREHPELSVGSNTDGIDVRSVGNSAVLKDTALVEAFNLKAAIEYNMKNYPAAQEALTDMPPRQEEELDPVSLHNQALMSMDEEPTSGFKKLNFLLSRPPFPPETFGNLLLLYCKFGFYDLAADVMAENVELTTGKHLSPDLWSFLDATIQLQTAPDEAYAKYDELASKHIEVLRKLTKAIQDARLARDPEGIKKCLKEYDDTLEGYIPVLMAMARIYWDLDNYSMVEKIFRQSAEFCSEHDVWKLNVAHVFFMQDNKFNEAIKYYEPFVKRSLDSVLSVPAMVLANLCVGYIMTSQNELAEDLLRKVEKEEEQIALQDSSRNYVHLCIINLVIGTLYCAKSNYEFGISRIIKSLEPINKKLQADTWHYSKRCLLGLLENLAKHMQLVKDQTFHDILQFLDACEVHGQNVATQVTQTPDLRGDGNYELKTVAYEARCIKRMYMLLRD